jgi:hypothetical protein
MTGGMGQERREEIVQAVTLVVQRLVAGDFSELEQLTAGRRLSADEIRHAVEEYGRQLVLPPPGSLADDVDVVTVAGATPVRWSVVCSLWTEEEGRSDLSLELTLIDQGAACLVVEIDNIHVL